MNITAIRDGDNVTDHKLLLLTHKHWCAQIGEIKEQQQQLSDMMMMSSSLLLPMTQSEKSFAAKAADEKKKKTITSTSTWNYKWTLLLGQPPPPPPLTEPQTTFDKQVSKLSTITTTTTTTTNNIINNNSMRKNFNESHRAMIRTVVNEQNNLNNVVKKNAAVAKLAIPPAASVSLSALSLPKLLPLQQQQQHKQQFQKVRMFPFRYLGISLPSSQYHQLQQWAMFSTTASGKGEGKGAGTDQADREGAEEVRRLDNHNNQDEFDDDDDDNSHKQRRCWRCDKPINEKSETSNLGRVSSTAAAADDKVAICEHCGSIQPIAGDVNFFGLFNLDAHYDIDLSQLRRNYLRLQQNMHPDMNVNRSNTETGYSEDNSSIINGAYKTLRDPYQRALYLLRIKHNMTIDEGNIETEPELLLEIMELNEDIDLARDDKDALMAVAAQLEAKIDEIGELLKRAFADVDSNGGEERRLIVRYAYYRSTMDKLRGQLV